MLSLAWTEKAPIQTVINHKELYWFTWLGSPEVGKLQIWLIQQLDDLSKSHFFSVTMLSCLRCLTVLYQGRLLSQLKKDHLPPLGLYRPSLSHPVGDKKCISLPIFPNKISEVHSDWPVAWEIECADSLNTSQGTLLDKVWSQHLQHTWIVWWGNEYLNEREDSCGFGQSNWKDRDAIDWNGKCTGRNWFEEGG